MGDEGHRSRNLRHPAATDQALRAAHPKAVLALDSWPKELPFDQNHRERKGAGKGVGEGVGKGVDKGVEKIVENFVKKWKKMENYSYFCAD